MLKFLGKIYIVINLLFIVMLSILLYNNHLSFPLFLISILFGVVITFLALKDKSAKMLLITELVVFIISGAVITYFLINKDFLNAFVAFFCVALAVDGFWLGFFNNLSIRDKLKQKRVGQTYMIMNIFFLTIFVLGILLNHINMIIGGIFIILAIFNLIHGLKLKSFKTAMITQSIFIALLGTILLPNYLEGNYATAFYYFIGGGMIIDSFWSGMLLKEKA